MSIRTDNLNVQSLLARAQSRLNSSTTAQTASDSAIKKSDAQAGATKTDSTQTETTEAEKVRKLAPSLSKAHERIAAQAQAGSTSLSALGQFKSSLVDLATAGKEMAALTATSTTQSVQGALEKLVARYNASAAKGNASAAAGSTTDVGASRALRELRAAIMSVTGSATSPSLARIGIVQRQDGTLAVDAKALEKSMATDPAGVTSALAGIGKAVENSANDALSTGSRLSSSMASLGDRVKALQQQQSAVVATAEKLGDSLVGSANWNRMVLDAYLKN
ncbi:flagellar filament capping protein FliD [Delftia tsuruhatensis]|uniref:flagellar filament capping protein FliD n=1 Tax=Delftia tsuruhatensis TaxID=180282 RepID=UPI0024443AFE|nr:flagellar filament capping protein FliD [Delftia tsuruhatensis]MDH0775539.1 flagellar filament capping protein FliD [Delftia tsuruhatensis]MDH1461634.1 flagellar filament capping protein FliD [Delftia tsuruhatensis]MDH1826275.1 flagellar filament capping protein FliD [Delftia tsuruhatensis]WGG13886.1 flagellar filament capping protein FliD [Delftia tsuruhatensis]